MKKRTPRLTESEVAELLPTVPEWRVIGGVLTRRFAFADFAGAMRFVNRVAGAAEAADHHPDMNIRYNKVTLGFTTHDSGGLTALDFDGARSADGFLSGV